MTLALLVAAASGWPLPARAESPYERDQREMLEKARREQTLSPQAERALRWEREWREQHPGQPVPNAGVLQKLHRQETLDITNADFDRMRAARQAELKREYLLSRRNQAQKLAAQHVTWTAQQWREWDRAYDLAQQKKAQDYLKASEQAGEIFRLQREREEQEKLWKQR